LGSAEVLLVRQIVDQFATGLFAKVLALLAVMSALSRAELGQIGRKMTCNECFGASLASEHAPRKETSVFQGGRMGLY